MFTRYEYFSTSISAIYHYIQKIERSEMEKYGLKGSFAQYLLVMTRYPDGITAAELCDVCEKDKGAVSRALSALEEKGLIHRPSEEESRYRALIQLTEEGKTAAEFVSQRSTLAVELAGTGLSDTDRQTFYSALNLIATNLHNISKHGIPSELESTHTDAIHD